MSTARILDGTILARWARENEYTPEIKELTATARERVKDLIPELEWRVHAG